MQITIFFNALGFAYFQTRDLDKARDQHDRTADLIAERSASVDIYTKNFYMLGKNYKQQGH